MEGYKKKMATYYDEYIDKWTEEERINADDNFNEWQNTGNNDLIAKFYENSNNRLYYTRSLYDSQVDCFYQILLATKSIESITRIIENVHSVVSLGCGPGPEIAGYITYVRDILGCRDHKLEILAIDRARGWAPFIGVISDIDKNVTITFKSPKLKKRRVPTINSPNICLVSYPNEMYSSGIWKKIIYKFTIVIFIDHPQHELRDKMINLKFTPVDFNYKGDKTFFYHIKEDRINGAIDWSEPNVTADRSVAIERINFNCGHRPAIHCYENEVKCTRVVTVRCARNIHESSVICGSASPKCDWKIKIDLNCGHQKEISCFENEEEVKKSKACETMVKVKCKRNKHQSFVDCDSSEKCQSKIRIKLKCGHERTIICWDVSSEVRPCTEMISKLCKRKLHNRKVRCGHKYSMNCSDEKYWHYIDAGSDIKYTESSEICRRKVQIQLKCGHERTIICGDVSSELSSCTEKISKLCERKLHHREIFCSSSSSCDENIICKTTCGHKYTMKCSEKIPWFCIDDNSNIPKRIANKCEYFTITRDYRGDTRQCEDQCNISLSCGHICHRKCYQCLNGRLHRRCVEKCSRSMKCSHICSDNCHEGDCVMCEDNCFNFGVKSKLLAFHVRKWKKVLSVLIKKGPTDFRTLFDELLTKILQDRFFAFELRYFKWALGKIKKLLALYHLFIHCSFPILLKDYMDDVHRSVLDMFRRICMDNGEMMDVSDTDFDVEFTRIENVSVICYRFRSFLEEAPTLDKILPILFTLRMARYTEDKWTEIYHQSLTLWRNI